MKRSIGILLLLCLSFVLAAGTACAATEKFTEEKYFSYTLNDDGKGYTVAASDEVMPLTVIIPEEYNGLPVTAVAEKGFNSKNCIGIKEVVVKAKNVTVGRDAFRDLPNLRYIEFRKSMDVKIEPFAFHDCKALVDLVITKIPHNNDQKVEFEEFSFQGIGLKKLNVPVTATVKQYAFADCEKLVSYSFTGNSAIDANAFYNCSALNK